MANEIENPDGILCDYDCGQIAKFQFRNGRYCCGDHYSKCPSGRKINSRSKIGIKKSKYLYIENLDGILCDYGCNQPARYKFISGKYCCNNHVKRCEGEKNKIKKNRFIQKIDKPDDSILCNYGCGKPANFQLKNGKVCCDSHQNKCPIIREKNKSKMIGKKFIKYEKIENNDENILCDYGCNQPANFQLKNGKFCCTDNASRCPSFVGPILKFSKAVVRYPDVISIEGLIRGPNDEILGHCKNANCPNSEENGGYFVVTTYQIHYRNLSINSTTDGYYLYCCEECKKECVLFGKTVIQLENLLKPYNTTNPNQATSQELSIWRSEVFIRQLKDNPIHSENFCERCHSTENLVGHHIQPQKLYPEFALDPINGIIFCSECHNKYGHEKGTECSTGNLANKPCK
jgi:hypothetical protein